MKDAMLDAAMEEAADRGRLATLYELHAPDAVRLAYLLTGDRTTAEDLAQDAFVKMVGRLRDLRSPDAFGWYLRRTVVNLSRSHFRRRGVERAYLRRQRPTEAVPPADPTARDAMWRALQVLPERQRAAIVLRYYEDLTEAQTATVLGSAVGTVKSLVSRGMARLREELSRDA